MGFFLHNEVIPVRAQLLISKCPCVDTALMAVWALELLWNSTIKASLVQQTMSERLSQKGAGRKLLLKNLFHKCLWSEFPPVYEPLLRAFPHVFPERKHFIAGLVHSAQISKAPGTPHAWCSESALMSIHTPGVANAITPSVLTYKIVSVVCETTALAGYLATAMVWRRDK